MGTSRRSGPLGRPEVPPGIQPEADGRLQCLECGRWYRQLGQHVVRTHEMSADDYRRIHELPAGRGLHAADILERRAARARADIAADPEGYRAQRLTPKHTTVEERKELARVARAESLDRAGVRAAGTESGKRAAKAWRAHIDAPMDARAQELGFAGIAELLAAKSDLSNRDLGDLLGLKHEQAWKLRRRFGMPSPGRWPEGYVPQSPQYRPRLSEAELAALAPGEQPERDGMVACRDCGLFVIGRGLPQHLGAAHASSVADYHRRHGMDRSDERAEELGYTDIAALLAATAHLNGPDFAELLGTTRTEAAALRRRHGYRTPQGATVAPSLDAKGLDALPLGVQPEQYGKLLCRECGGWFRGLSQHLPHKHGVTPAEYRERYGLAVGHCLQAEDLHELRAANGRARSEAEPEWYARFRAGARSTADPEQLAKAQAGRRASWARPGGRAHLLSSGDRIAKILPQRTHEDFERRARELSYDSIEAMLEATAGLTGAALAELLGVADHRVYSLRQRYGFRSPGRHRGVTPEDAGIAAGVSPDSDQRLTCLECGKRYQFLGKHASLSHGLSPDEYRARHGLPPDTPLHPLQG